MKMSWNDYITNRLISSVDSNNHILENVVEEACIINKSDGIEWASTPNFSIDKREVTIEEIGEIILDEFENISDAFANKGDCTKAGGIRLNNIKYLMINFDTDKNSMYLRRQKGGAVIAATNLAYIIATFNAEKKMKKDGVEEYQNNGYCAKVVEELAEFFVGVNY